MTDYARIKQTFGPSSQAGSLSYRIVRCSSTGAPLAVVVHGARVSGAYAAQFVPPWVGVVEEEEEEENRALPSRKKK